MKEKESKFANPGPSWGFQIIALCERWLPGFLFRFLLDTGTFIGLLCMAERRRHSAEYWRILTGREPTRREQFRHFRSFMDGLVLKLQAGRGKFPEFRFARDAHQQAFIETCRTDQPVLFGTFHVGHSDMMGCMLKDFQRPIAMVRHQVGNSRDTEILARSFPGNLTFLWINDPGQFIFDLKDAIQRGCSIGLQCDRMEFSSKRGCFAFLGASREFPLTIYHLSGLFGCPVVFSFTGPLEADGIEVYTSQVFHPGPDRRQTLEQGKLHFQQVLARLEAHLREHPDLWFNFAPLNPVCDEKEGTDD